MFSGLIKATGATDQPTAKIDNELLNLIDEYAEGFYDGRWNLTLEQYKAWVATIAWGEGGRGGYTAHSRYAPGSDVFYHKVVGKEFNFSTGIGPFQLDVHGANWPTIKKLNPKEALFDVLKWHCYDFKEKYKRIFGTEIKPEDVTLANFSEISDWNGVTPGRVEAKWKEVTGTNWDTHKTGRVELDWQQIRSQIGTNVLEYSFGRNVIYKGRLKWHVSFTTDSEKHVSLDGYYDTWLITARDDTGRATFDYYYTYDKKTCCEVWVWANDLRYIFVRDYTTGRLPEHVSGNVAGEDTLEEEALNLNDMQWPQISKALNWLREQQNMDGSWTYAGRIIEENVGLSSLALLSLLNWGLDEVDFTVLKAINWILEEQKSDGSMTTGIYEVYDTSLAVLALTATRNKNYYNNITAAARFLIDIQNDEDTGYSKTDKYYGGWPYWKGMTDWADLSNTQFAMLALWYAEQFNPSDTIVPADVWDKAEIFLTRCQNRKASNPDYSFYDDGGFIYQPESTIWASGRSYGSMTAAGLWGLFTCGIGKEDGKVKDAWEWFENNYHIDQNYPMGNKFLYYYLYCFAKACMLWNVNNIAGHDWYQEMSELIINNQQAEGHWLGTDPYEEPDLVATCWALLALETKIIAAGTKLRVKVDSPADLHIYDPLDRHVGINYETGEVEIEIPEASYSGPETEPQIIEIPDPIAGNYRIRLVGREKGAYTLTIEGMIGNETAYSRNFEGIIDIKEEKELNAIISGIAGPITIDVLDNIPPDAITDLRMIDATLDSITLTWTSPGDDWRTGTASKYDVRYSTEPITEDNWDEAIQCEGEPEPQPAGTLETFVVTNLTKGITYYFAIKSADEIPNWSSISNIAKGFTWSYIFEDTCGRNTTLKINTNERAFQFIAPNKDYEIRNATYMKVYHRTIFIRHEDNELKLLTLALDTKLDFCIAIAWDRQTKMQYYLIDKVGFED
jgi:hypothetical protein